jgi:hypothetical protein
MTEGMFSALWTKYLPILRIMLKKSITGEQQVSVGKLELSSVDNRKNANHTFTIEISKGKASNMVGSKVIAKDLVTVLNGDPLVRSFLADKLVHISMGKNSQLLLRTDLLAEQEASVHSDEASI